MGRKNPEAKGKPNVRKLAAEIKVDGRDYVFQSCHLMHRAAQVKDCFKQFEKRLKTTCEKLADEVDRGVCEGPRSGILFPSLEAARQQAEATTIQHLEIAAGVGQRLMDVPLADLERVRKGIEAVLDSACKAAVAAEEKAMTAGATSAGNTTSEAAG